MDHFQSRQKVPQEQDEKSESQNENLPLFACFVFRQLKKCDWIVQLPKMAKEQKGEKKG